MAEGEDARDVTVTDTALTDEDAQDDDAAWPVLSELDLQVCLTDSGIPGLRGDNRGSIPTAGLQ